MMKKIFIYPVILFFLLSCSVNQSEISERTKLPSTEIIRIDLTVSRNDLLIALGDEYKTSKMRAVEVFQNSTSGATKSPVFRLFEVEPGSVYDLLGLREADMIVAINQRIIVAPHVIGQIVRLLPKENQIQIEILRAGKSYLLVTKFI